MIIHHLSSVNAVLNSLSFILLVLGYRSIKSGRKERHKKLMLSAVLCSVAFLICYIVYHFYVGSVKFQGIGWSRLLYFAILMTHTIFAIISAPMVVITLYRGLKNKFERHQKIAKITFPLWSYVSFTGVLVYVMLYHLFR